MDYFWLVAALLGILGAVSIGRQGVAQNLLATASARLETSASGVESALRFGTSGTICRRFVRSKSSPPPEVFDLLQREFDDQCAWFTEAAKRLTASPFAKRKRLTLEALGGAPPKGGDDWAVTYLRERLDWYNQAVSDFERLSEAAKRAELEWALSLLGPSLLAVALALRIAKVTGEIRHER